MPFKKGQSGNPGGRPKKDPAIAAALGAATPEAIQVLVDVMTNVMAPAAARVSAATAILDRSLGKPVQPVSGDADGEPLSVIVTGVPRDGD